MPLYRFELREGSAPLADDAGVHLPDRESALIYARDVARELMHGREDETRSWRLDVYEHHERVFELRFAALDRSLDHLRPGARSIVESLCERRRSTSELLHTVWATMRESRALVAKSRGKPYLAAIYGRQTIR